jgi:hypothetical protein
MTMNCNFGIQVFSITGVTVDTQSKGEPFGPACRFLQDSSGWSKSPTISYECEGKSNRIKLDKFDPALQMHMEKNLQTQQQK